MEPIDLSKAIARAKELPSLPQNIARLLEELRNPDVDLDELSKDIALDQAITAKILRLVNSSFYGMPGQIGNLNQAVVILGIETIQNMVLSIAMVKAFRLPDVGKEGFRLEDFWNHTISVGLITQELAKKYAMKHSQDAFVGGLLHDIGKLLLLQVCPDGFKMVLKAVREEGLYFREAERRYLTAEHAQLGAWLGKKWHFPLHLQHVILYHHHPQKAHFAISRATHLADALAIALGCGDSGCPLVPAIDPLVIDEFNLSRKTVSELLRGMEDIFRTVGDTSRILLE